MVPCQTIAICSLPQKPAWSARSLRLGILVVLALQAVNGCSRSAIEPTGRPISITPRPDVVILGAKLTLTAVDAVSGASVQAVWTSSDTRIATAASGELSLLAPGSVAITASFKGSSTTLVIKIVPDFSGRYSGRVPITSCTEKFNGSVCGLYAVQANAGIAPFDFIDLTLSQTKDTVSGRLEMGTGRGSIQGQIDSKGSLCLTGTLASIPTGAQLQILEFWTSHLEDDGTVLYGSFGGSDTQAEDGRLYAIWTADILGIVRVR
jgi:hypothetical protein